MRRLSADDIIPGSEPGSYTETFRQRWHRLRSVLHLHPGHYYQADDGSIRRVHPKLKGKAAVKRAKRQRQAHRQHILKSAIFSEHA